MIKTVTVMDRHSAEELLRNTKASNLLVISISTPRDERANLGNRPSDILYLSFCDCDSGDDITVTLISEYDASKIVDFVNTYNDKTEEFDLIVHCDAGRSRSAGVAAAIEKYLYNYDKHYFTSSKYNPNMLCYRRVLDNFMK